MRTLFSSWYQCTVKAFLSLPQSQLGGLLCLGRLLVQLCFVVNHLFQTWAFIDEAPLQTRVAHSQNDATLWCAIMQATEITLLCKLKQLCQPIVEAFAVLLAPGSKHKFPVHDISGCLTVLLEMLGNFFQCRVHCQCFQNRMVCRLSSFLFLSSREELHPAYWCLVFISPVAVKKCELSSRVFPFNIRIPKEVERLG